MKKALLPFRFIFLVAFFTTLAVANPENVSGTAYAATIAKTVPMKRIAFVVGNAAYPSQPLPTARNDARSMTRLLAAMNFEVVALDDVSHDAMQSALAGFKSNPDKFDVALFYFAGHAVRSGRSTLLLPADVQASSHLPTRGVDVTHVLAALTAGRSGQSTLLIVDACLADAQSHHPVTDEATAFERRLPPQTLLAFGSAPGGAAYDDGMQHGLFTRELVRLLANGDLSVQDALTQARQSIVGFTHAAQRPGTVSTLQNSLYLRPQTMPTTPTLVALADDPNATIGSPRGLLPQDGEARIELEFWKSIEKSTDASDYEAYLKTYPNGRFAALAKARIERYKKTAPQIAPAAAKPAIEPIDLDYIATSDANLRREPLPTAGVAGQIAKGTTVHITGRTADGRWYRIKTASGDSYIDADLVGKPAPAARPSAPPPQPERVAEPARPAAAAPVARTNLQTAQDCPTCPTLVMVPAGKFTMGDNQGDRSEKPAHTVVIGRPFAIGKTEVTTSQWKECVAAGQCTFKAESSGADADAPVRDISWTDAQQYVRWLSQKTKQTYRLPSEAEWEYAARAGSQSRYWWGEQVGTGNANCRNCGGAWSHAAPASVNAFPPNAFGLMGMNGSVWEWVQDCWFKSHEGAPTDGSSRDAADCRQHVIRGGSWRDDATYVHSASRFSYDTDVRYLSNGFRVAKTLP